MDFFQGVVVDYLRADRAVFVNLECCIQLNDLPNPDISGPHWYCDAVAIDLRRKEVFLCEISYEARLSSLTDRLKSWSEHWAGVCAALERDSGIPGGWPVRPWLFVPEAKVEILVARLGLMVGTDGAPVFKPRITALESVQPWHYRSWNHRDEETDKPRIPEPFRV